MVFGMNRSRQTVTAAVFAVALSVTCLYYLLAGALSEVGDTSPFAGSAFVLVPEAPGAGGAGAAGQLRLDAAHLSADGPHFAYSLTQCGRSAGRAWLVLTGDARLTDLDVLGSGVAVREVDRLTLDSPLGALRLGRGQIFEIDLPEGSPCAGGSAPDGDDLWVGTGVRIEGSLRAPVLRRVTFGPIGRNPPRRQSGMSSLAASRGRVTC